eukprot:29243-Amphidinium_carterae.1
MDYRPQARPQTGILASHTHSNRIVYPAPIVVVWDFRLQKTLGKCLRSVITLTAKRLGLKGFVRRIDEEAIQGRVLATLSHEHAVMVFHDFFRVNYPDQMPEVMQPIERRVETRDLRDELRANFICHRTSKSLQLRMNSSSTSRVSPDPDVEGVDMRSAKVSSQDREVSRFCYPAATH